MSRYFKSSLVTAAIFSMTVSGALAADLDPPVIEHVPEISLGGGFYLRGDIGVSIWQDPELEFVNDVAGFASPIDNESTENALVIGGGVGYDFKKYLRVDLTADIRTNKDVSGTIECGACVAFASIGNRTLGQQTDLDLATFFANAYFDIGDYHGFTPYIGGGVGAAYVSYGNYLSTNNPTANNSPGATAADLLAANPSGVENQIFEGESGFRFAWNLQAGASYDINDNLALDGSYRYTRINGGAVAPNIGGVGSVDSDDLVGHEIRLGLRYTFGAKAKHHDNLVFK